MKSQICKSITEKYYKCQKQLKNISEAGVELLKRHQKDFLVSFSKMSFPCEKNLMKQYFLLTDIIKVPTHGIIYRDKCLNKMIFKFFIFFTFKYRFRLIFPNFKLNAKKKNFPKPPI